MLSTRSTEPSTEANNVQSLRLFPLSPRERGLLLALMWGEPLPQAALRLELSQGEAHQMLSRLQQRAGVFTRRALIARAVAHRWAG